MNGAVRCRTCALNRANAISTTGAGPAAGALIRIVCDQLVTTAASGRRQGAPPGLRVAASPAPDQLAWVSRTSPSCSTNGAKPWCSASQAADRAGRSRRRSRCRSGVSVVPAAAPRRTSSPTSVRSRRRRAGRVALRSTPLNLDWLASPQLRTSAHFHSSPTATKVSQTRAPTTWRCTHSGARAF